MTDDRKKTIPVDPTLSTRQPDRQAERVHAEQGPAPADYAERPESGAPQPSGEGLTSDQVTALLGSENADAASVTGTNRALQQAEDIDPDAGQA